MLQKLPVGIQTFEKIRTENLLYVDKTQVIHRLITLGDYFFLSRPRRSGKSLTLSTIEAIYSGRRELFEGLWIEDRWDWDRVHSVIHISFSSVDYQGSGLEVGIAQQLILQAEKYSLQLASTTIKNMLAELIRKLAGDERVVLLIDEYDKPIIDYLSDMEQAKENQAILKTLFSVIKDSDPYIEFMLLAGVSKFSKVSIFSDLNNLSDITQHRYFAALTGYTQAELEGNFEPYMLESESYLGLKRAELLAQLRYWYNGYSWDGRTYVYNPFSILSFFQQSEFRNFWFETGTPTFLLKLLREDWRYQLEEMTVGEEAFANYDIENLQAIPVLFQSGYLTIKERREFGIYVLGYPNAEVKESFLAYVIADLRNEQTALTRPMVVQLYQAFQHNDLEQVIRLIRSIFKNIPSQIFIRHAEAYYHSLIYLVFFYVGQYIESEVNTNNGRLDCVVQSASHIYIIEFKLDQSAEAALAQIKARGYADKYLSDPRPKVLLGINFSSQTKTVDSWVTDVVN